jgi:hypothetical protein
MKNSKYNLKGKIFTLFPLLFLVVSLSAKDLKDFDGKESENLKLSEETKVDSQSVAVKFKDLSLSIQKHSFLISAFENESNSAKAGKERTSKHWHPKLYLEGRSYTTNDPALNFFSKLGQRDARQSDFSTKSVRSQVSNFLDTSNQPYTTLNSQTANIFAPDTLNYPGANTYQKGTLGVDLALYEGGAKSNMAESYGHISKGKNLEKQSVILSEYSSTASLYAQLIYLKNYKKQIIEIEKQLQSVLKNYQVGARSNPVGYSGLLGLKSLKNKLEGMHLEVDTHETSIRSYLSTMTSEFGDNWTIQLEPIDTFLNSHLPKPRSNKDSALEGVTLSYQSLAMQEYAESASLAAEAEKAKFLPKAGVFGESNLYNGSRNTATAYNVGFYVQMNLYNADDIGAYEEAKLKAQAQREKVQDQIRKESAKRKELIGMEKTLEKQLLLLADTSKLMEEQISNAKRMFYNGSINAIQLSEIFSRSTDLVVQDANANREYILIRSELYTLFSNNNPSKEDK